MLVGLSMLLLPPLRPQEEEEEEEEEEEGVVCCKGLLYRNSNIFCTRPRIARTCRL
jgi:hypothetical protein